MALADLREEIKDDHNMLRHIILLLEEDRQQEDQQTPAQVRLMTSSLTPAVPAAADL